MKQISKVNADFYPTSNLGGQLLTGDFNLGVNEKTDETLPKICTLLTKDYLVQGLALYYSLKRHTPRFRLWVLCVDDTSYNLLQKMNLADVTLVSLDNIKNNKLIKIERNRKVHEFCWTLKAVLLTYLLKNNCNLDSILYMDADLFFFKDVREIYNEWGDKSVYLTKLWLGPKSERKSGRYSAGLIGFKRDKVGMRCLQSWRQKCLKWCYDQHEKGRWADQKYLDAWPHLFSRVNISQNKGINAGPWNIRKGSLVRKDDVIYYDSTELVCYHFSGFEIITENEFELCNRKKLPAKAKDIYSPYADEIRQTISKISSQDKNFMQNIIKNKSSAYFNHYVIRSEPHD